MERLTIAEKIDLAREQFLRQYQAEREGLSQQELRRKNAQYWVDVENENRGNAVDPSCPQCRGKGYTAHLDGEYNQYHKPCSCEKRFVQEKYIRNSGLKGEFESKTFEKFKTALKWQQRAKNSALNYVQHCAKGGDKWFMLSGKSGCGKTHLCTAIAGKLIEQGNEVVYLSYIKEIPEIKQKTLEVTEYNNILNRWLSCEVLYIDDLFKGDVTAADIKLVMRIINYRYVKKLRTIISTERAPIDLDLIDSAITGRIIEKCLNYYSYLGGEADKNYRLNFLSEET